MLLALSGLDGSQLGSKRAVVYSQDKKKDSYTEGYFEEKTPVVFMTSNMFALESVDPDFNIHQSYALNMILKVEIGVI